MRTLVSVLVGIFSLALGLIPILNHFNVINLSLPFTATGLILAVLMVIGAIILFVDASDASADPIQWATVIAGIVMIVLGLAIIAGYFVPSVANIAGTVTAIPWLVEILLTIAGILLIIGGIMGY